MSEILALSAPHDHKSTTTCRKTDVGNRSNNYTHPYTAPNQFSGGGQIGGLDFHHIEHNTGHRLNTKKLPSYLLSLQNMDPAPKPDSVRVSFRSCKCNQQAQPELNKCRTNTVHQSTSQNQAPTLHRNLIKNN